jgi:hypothetical protein
VLWELVSQRGTDLIVALAFVSVGSGEAFEVGDRFNIPNDDAGHAAIQQVSRPPNQTFINSVKAPNTTGSLLLGCMPRVVGPLVHVDAPARWCGREKEAFALVGGEAPRHLCFDAIYQTLSFRKCLP